MNTNPTEQNKDGGGASAPSIDPKLAQEVFEKLLAGEDVTEKVETRRGSFTLKYPCGREFIEIDRRKAIMRNGVPASSFDREAEANMEAYASLDVVIVDAPKWWESLKGGSSGCPDADLINDLYRGYLRFTAKIRALLSFGNPGESGGNVQADNKNPTVGRGLFQNLAFRSKDGKSK
jgi:hypothetical protein